MGEHAMRMRPSLRVAPLVLLALTAGACGEDELDRLEELPPELAADLHRVPNTDLLIAEPGAQAVDCGVPTQTVRPCAASTEHRVMATYPVTVCYPPNFPTEGVLVEQSPPGPTPAPPVPATQTFKLTAFGGTAFPHPLRCVVKGGPFLVTIVESENCSRTVLNHFGVTTLLPCAGCPPLEWCGELDNHPPQLKPFGPVSSKPLPQFDCDPGDLNTCATGFEPPDDDTPIP